MKRGNMEAIYAQAREEAEKEVIRRMIATNVDLNV